MRTFRLPPKMRSPLKYFGGKSYLHKWITGKFPEHKVYVEPFFGGGSVLLNKRPAEIEIVGDIDPGVIRFWKTLRDRGPEVCEAASWVTYDKINFDHAVYMLSERAEHIGDVGFSVEFLVRSRFSIGGAGKAYSWSDRERGGQPENVNSWDTIRAELPKVVDRIRCVSFYAADACDMIREYASADTLTYCDPPYLQETRTAKDVYEHEMTTGDHVRLLECLREVPGKRFISGYRSDLYDNALWAWDRHEKDMPNHSAVGKTKQRRVECLWESL